MRKKPKFTVIEGKRERIQHGEEKPSNILMKLLQTIIMIPVRIISLIRYF